MGCISTRGIYGLAAMVELASNEGRSMQIKEIAQIANIPQNYLEQILASLRKHGLLESIRGINGGYKLAKDPSAIQCVEILEALEGEFSFGSQRFDNPALQYLFGRIDEQIQNVLQASLRELADYQQRFRAHPVYYI